MLFSSARRITKIRARLGLASSRVPSWPLILTIFASPPPHPSAMTDPQPSTPVVATSPSKAAQLRLQTLQYLVQGFEPSTASASSSSATALARLANLVSSLESLKHSSGKPLTRLLDDWSSYRNLLHPHSQPLLSSWHSTWDPIEQSTYLLSQHSDLLLAHQELARIEALVEQAKVLDADRNRTLSRAIGKQEQLRLDSIRVQQDEQRTKSEALNERVLNLIQEWSGYTSMLSQAFTMLDGQVLALERKVTALERHQHDES